MNLNQAKHLLAEAQGDLVAARQAQAQSKEHVSRAVGKVNAVLGSGIQLSGLKEAQGMLAGLSDELDRAGMRISGAHSRIGQAAGGS